ncbi:DUF2207 domain-containing protein [Planosporangium thailandense]|uniref:DUF2207 domain-containing protein n=1 Tax=Planosporangium thailandense TaxID=765197 RepID=A0ABX0Y1K1_9ACTN|nr:DUF2207 domain-containing protein [Planosporangium thailandense]NJC72223.1 DUF2207 domain-containing protein [Planosporangium thailandense]
MINLLIELGLPAVSLAVWLAAYAGARVLTRPAGVAAGPATMDLPGTEPPAVVSLLANRWQVTVDAAESTLLDLVARGCLELRQAGPDPRHTTVHVTGEPPVQLTAYERQVYDRVVERAVGGVVPLTALGFDDAKRAAAWARRFRVAVIADARRLKLSQRRLSPTVVTALSVLAAFTAAGVTAGAAHYMRRDDGDYSAVPGLFLVVTAALCGVAAKVGGERDTAAGRAVAARWLGVRDWLAGHESFADLPPAAVTVWDRYLPYGAALGVTRVASKVIDLGLADRKRIWSSYTGGWRRVTVTYPRLLPRYGQRPGWILFRAAIAAVIGWNFAPPRDLWHGLFESDPVGVVFTLVGSALLGYAGYTAVRVLLDAVAPVTVTGEVLWHQVWRTRQVGSDNRRRSIPSLYYLVVDDGRADRTRAWILPAEIADRCRTGDVVTARIRPWTRRVVDVALQRLGPGWSQPAEVTSAGEEELIAAASSPAGGAPGVTPDSAGGTPVAPASHRATGQSLRTADLLTAEEVAGVLGRAVTPDRVPMSDADLVQAACFNDSDGRTALTIEVSRGERGAGVLAARRTAGGPLPRVADEAYIGKDRVTARLGDLVVELAVGTGAGGAGLFRVLPLLGIALKRLASDG